MGFISKIEQGLEKAVRSTFSKGGTEFEPVDVANRLRTELDNKAYSISSGRTLAPNVFTIKFAHEDYPRVQGWGAPLAEELCDVAIRHARTQGYTLRGPVRVTFLVDPTLEQGEFDIYSSQESASAQSGSATQASPSQSIPQRISRPDAARRPAQVPAPASDPAPARPKPQVVLDINGQSYSIRVLPVVLGRGSSADLTVEDAGVSRRHLEIIEQDGTYLAVDLGSTNGTFHNGERLTGRRELNHGDVLTIGRARIVFRLMILRGGR